ncbi:hypothetical protein IPG41_04305 [Candidatus Peregrinibacteria bacterium]|nr:MAG: hypothetical protein IPG41_04305 [Candidatus Peregrinibacteria bacterium]
METLMSLKIPSGWAVSYNRFLDLSIDDSALPSEDLELFGEDMLQLQSMILEKGVWLIPPEHFLIDLGWYPEADPKGQYKLLLAHVDRTKNKKWKELKTFRSKDRFEIREMLESWIQEKY